MEPVKLLERVATGTAHTIRHPVSSAAYAFGVVRGVAGVIVTGATGHGAKEATPVVPDPRPEPGMPAAEQVAPAPPGESFATEPSATSRASAHGRSGADAEIDAWADEEPDAPDLDLTEADLPQPGAEPLLDPGTAKAIRSEAAMMQKAADPDRG